MELQPISGKRGNPDFHNSTVHPDDVEATERNNENLKELHQTMRPLLIIMGVLGLWHPSNRELSCDTLKQYRFSSLTRWICIIISFCNFGYTFANTIFFLTANPPVEMQHLTYNVYIIVVVWLSYACLLSVLHFRICERGWLFEIWQLWSLWARLPRKRNWNRIQNLRTVYIVIAILVTLIPTVIIAIGSAYMKVGGFLEPYFSKLNYGSLELNHRVFVVDLVIITFAIYGTAAFTTAFFVTICLILTDELRFLHDMIEDRLESGRIWNNVKEGDEEISVLEQLRRRRLECRNFVEAVDKTFEHTAFLSIFANVPLIVFIAYAMVTHPRTNMFTHGMCTIAILVSLFQVIAVSVAAAWVNKWADKPKKLLHTLKIHNYVKMSRINQASLSLFLSELTSESLGITAWELTIITKEFVATAIGLAVSYIIVLAEFGHMSELLKLVEEISKKLTNCTIDITPGHKFSTVNRSELNPSVTAGYSDD